MISENEYLAAVYAFTYFGPARLGLMLSYFKKPANIWRAKEKAFLEIGISKTKAAEFIEFRRKFDIDKYFKKLKSLKINFITIFDKNYPSNLTGLDGAPMVLYYKGVLKGSDVNSVAVVGTRKMTSYGREVAASFSEALAQYGVTIVSGLARGIDTAAHKGALSAGGRTVAVLGNGLDSIYPPENIDLAREIVKCGGAVVSEYPLGYPALPVNFAIRNRIISGLSKAVVVIEGAEKSGTLLTARHAAEQGKTVFAVPGQITSPLSAAPHFLIKDGARIAFSPKDILDELNMELRVDPERIEKVLPTGPTEEKLLTTLENEPMHLDEIVRISGITTSEVSARLTFMEMKGMVKNLGQGVYRKV